VPSCFFIGHADVPPEIYPHLLKAIEALVADNRVSTFYVGRYGAFDRLAIRALQQIKRTAPAIRAYLLIPYHPAQRPVSLPDGFDGSIYPFEKMPLPRVAIVRANKSMIDRCDYLIAYAHHPGKARDFLEYAARRQKRGKIRVQNIALPDPERSHPADE
jgi:hypothetical protein